MAVGVCLGLAGAKASPSQIPSRETPSSSIYQQSLWTKLINTRQDELLNTFSLGMYLMMVIVLPLWGSWQAACLRSCTETQRGASHLTHDSRNLFILYSTVLTNGHVEAARYRLKRGEGNKTPPRDRRFATMLCTILLLCGDIHLNPGPGNSMLPRDEQRQFPLGLEHGQQRRNVTPGVLGQATEAVQLSNGGLLDYGTAQGKADLQQVGNMNGDMLISSSKSAQTCCRGMAEIKQQQIRLFQTVNHARVLWDPKLKPKGIFGGHLNIRSLVSKAEQIEHLLTDSNVDYLCLSETWLNSNTPSGVYSIPGYRIFRRDRGHGKGGGVMIYVKERFQCKQIDLPNDLECVGITISLSPEMSFNVIILYRPPSDNDVCECR